MCILVLHEDTTTVQWVSFIREKFHHSSSQKICHALYNNSVYNAPHTLPTEILSSLATGDEIDKHFPLTKITQYTGTTFSPDKNNPIYGYNIFP